MRLVYFLLFFLWVGESAAQEPLRAPLLLSTPEGRSVPLLVEVASTPEARQMGLMGRTSLAEGQGMLFIFPLPTRGGFWMKDTLIPLSAGFFNGQGVLLQVLDMAPCTADPCPVYTPGVWYRYVIEVPQGWFSQAGTVLGTVFSLPQGGLL
mgnify:CR=1 FL=1